MSWLVAKYAIKFLFINHYESLFKVTQLLSQTNNTQKNLTLSECYNTVIWYRTVYRFAFWQLLQHLFSHKFLSIVVWALDKNTRWRSRRQTEKITSVWRKHYTDPLLNSLIINLQCCNQLFYEFIYWSGQIGNDDHTKIYSQCFYCHSLLISI